MTSYAHDGSFESGPSVTMFPLGDMAWTVTARRGPLTRPRPR